MEKVLRKTDRKARLTLPADFASCLVALERHGDEVHVRRVKQIVGQRYSFKELMAKVTKKNLHAEVDFGPPVGKEAL